MHGDDGKAAMARCRRRCSTKKRSSQAEHYIKELGVRVFSRVAHGGGEVQE
jgi:hypothetical protein